MVCIFFFLFFFFFFNDTATTEIYTLSLHDALPIAALEVSSSTVSIRFRVSGPVSSMVCLRSEEHTSELQSRGHLVCRLLLEKKKKKTKNLTKTKKKKKKNTHNN